MVGVRVGFASVSRIRSARALFDAAARLEDNEGCNHAHAGVWASSSSVVTLESNFIHHGMGEGVVVEEQSSRGLLRNNVLANNHGPGVVISSEADAELWSNDIHHNSGPGVAVCLQGRAHVVGNTIHDGFEAAASPPASSAAHRGCRPSYMGAAPPTPAATRAPRRRGWAARQSAEEEWNPRLVSDYRAVDAALRELCAGTGTRLPPFGRLYPRLM